MVSAFFNPIISAVREIIAVLHWFSNVVALLKMLDVVSQLGSLVDVFGWLIASLASSFLAELLKSQIPTLLRLILREL